MTAPLPLPDDPRPGEVEAGSEKEIELRGLWLSRLMFGGLVATELQPFYAETRSYEEWLAASGRRLA